LIGPKEIKCWGQMCEAIVLLLKNNYGKYQKENIKQRNLGTKWAVSSLHQHIPIILYSHNLFYFSLLSIQLHKHHFITNGEGIQKSNTCVDFCNLPLHIRMKIILKNTFKNDFFFKKVKNKTCGLVNFIFG